MKDAQRSGRWRLELAATFALAAGGLAQQRPDEAPAAVTEQRLRELLQQVAGDDPRGQAFARLLEIGAPAAAAVVAAIERGDAPPDSQQFPRYLMVLGELGPAGLDAVAPLRLLATDATGETQRLLLECVLDLAPHLGTDSERICDLAHDRLHSLLEGDGEMAMRRRAATTWDRSAQLREVHAGMSCAQLLAASSSHGNSPSKAEAAMVLLSHATRTKADTDAAIACAMTWLEVRADLRTSELRTTTASLAFPNGLRSHRRFAAALLRMDPPPAAATKAHTYLLRHGLPHESWRAIEMLRTDATALRSAESTLRAVADDPYTERQLRYEVVTTLGLVRPLAPESRKVLELLTEEDDQALVARARAASRQHGEQGR